MSNAIETSHLAYRAGKAFEIADLSLSVPAGSIYGFLGPNGSGKTTTIRLLLGLLPPRGGTISVLGSPIPAASAQVLGRIGYVPEQPHLDPTMTVAETMRFHAAFYPTWDAARAESLRRTFRLRAEQPFGRLSKGQKGKAMMLLALAQQPELLVLDEPTDGLDPVLRRDLLAALLDYVGQRRATVFISSHLVHELERICDWVGVMDDGHLVAEVPMESFKRGIKRLRVADPPSDPNGTPFVVLSRSAPVAGVETWIVRGWEPPMAEYFASHGAGLRDVIDLDLEDGFVELLRTFRGPEV